VYAKYLTRETKINGERERERERESFLAGILGPAIFVPAFLFFVSWSLHFKPTS